MRVATWNVNGLRARLGLVERWLADRQPDVVMLQEIKQEDRLFQKESFQKLGYEAACHGEKAWNGVAVLARRPLDVTERGLPGYEHLGARMLSARTEGVVFVSVYVPNGKSVGHPDFERKLQWLAGLAGYLESLRKRGLRVLVGGDFNVAPTALDTWNEEGLRGTIFHTEAERAAFRRLLGLGFDDLFRLRRPERRAFSWWDYRGGAFRLDHGLRIDFLLGAGLAPSDIREVWIDREYRKKVEGLTPSDHAPVIADLS